MTLKDFFNITTWWGKIIGALLGYIAAGPAGTVFGLIVGNLFDRGLASHLANPHLLYHAQKKQWVQKVFFEATFSVMGHIAKADGRVSTEEIQMAKTLMQEMRLNPQQKEQAKRLFTEGKQSSFNLDIVLNELKRACRDNRELLKLFIDIQYRASQVDGLSIKKIKALDAIFSCLNFAPLHQQYRFYDDFTSSASSQKEKPYEQKHYQTQTPKSNLAQAYGLFELNPEATKLEVKKAYRRLLSKNHPDKLIAQGLPESMIKMANDKTHKIRQAYELICQSRGW